MHAILGASAACVATHPSDMCVALAALDAVVHVQGTGGERQIAFAQFHRLPGNAPERDNHLSDDELVVAIELPPPHFAAHCSYLKIRDRASYAFALVSVAAGLSIKGGLIEQARLALGGVAHKPWREATAEQALLGQAPSEALFTQAAHLLLQGARPLNHNGFKVPLAQRAIVRALSEAAFGKTYPGATP